ncbi:MAG: hydrogenase iron-sulfur subunit [Burkholderiales bacterium]|nr:hydrogenase iron-sulfur subunit [Burkholderiales bacterium]
MASNAAARPWVRIAAAIGRGLERAFAPEHNPWHQLGALGFYLFWIVTATGIYLYAFFDTSAAGAYASVEQLSSEQWYLGGIMRSLHRYASDAFAAIMLLHIGRELLRGHFASFRWFSWLSGVPLIWLAYASGIGGYWLVWDQLALFSITATAEWLDWLPLGGDAIVRNFIQPIDDRFFSLLIFLHIGIPLLLLAGMWIHIQRISHVHTLPPRSLAWGVLLTLLALAVAAPAASHAPADPTLLQTGLALDWFYLFIHPLQYETSPGIAWSFAAGATLLLCAMPALAARPAPREHARVDLDNCNGCARCADDCPYAAIAMKPRPGARAGQRFPVVIADACAGCGICAGACPSSTPFRSTDALLSGIDMPRRTVDDLRRELERALAGERGPAIVVFGCERAAALDSVRAEGVLALPLLCIAMLPPAFVEYALRAGAAGVVVNACHPGECEFRLGPQWIERRLSGEREPHLRTSVDPSRWALSFAGAGEERDLAQAVASLRAKTSAVEARGDRPRLRRLGNA